MVAGFVVAYVLLGIAGRSTVLDTTSLALIWPAGGVSLVWFLVSRARPVSVDTLVLALLTFAVNRLTGAGTDLALLLIVTNVVQTLVAVVLVRRLCPDLWGAGGARSIDSPVLLARFLAAAVVGTALGAAIGSVVLGLTQGGYETAGAILWFGRNLCGILMVAPVALMLLQRMSQSGGVPVLEAAGRAELALAVAFTIGMYALAFTFDDLPLAFPLLAGTVWVGMRFTTLVTAAHATLNGVATIRLTLAGIGPFAAVPDPQVSALLAQAYVVTIIVTGLTLSTGLDERRRLEAQVRQREEDAVYQARLLTSIVTSMTEGVMVVDETGELLVRNPAATRVPSLLTGEETLEEAQAFHRALRGETVRNLEVHVERDGERRVLSVSAVPLPRDVVRDRARVTMLVRDVTDDFRRREELTSFAGVVAHDLRNPLAAIDGWTELIGEEMEAGELDPALLGDFVARVRSSAGRMGELVGDLLGYATSDAQDLRLEPVDLAELAAEVARAHEAAGLVTVQPVPPVMGDRVLLRQLLDNLVGNALKYVAPGIEPKIEVSGRCRDGLVAVSVADNGIGLPEGQRELVFEEFHRAHRDDYEGTGLGLAICRRIATRLGGTIVAYDNPAGAGTVFELTLPPAT
ncbi:MAG: ATP-binding protein [Nocardioides sp.]